MLITRTVQLPLLLHKVHKQKKRSSAGFYRINIMVINVCVSIWGVLKLHTLALLTHVSYSRSLATPAFDCNAWCNHPAVKFTIESNTGWYRFWVCIQENCISILSLYTGELLVSRRVVELVSIIAMSHSQAGSTSRGLEKERYDS